MIGTPDYIAPEIILNKRHSFTVDWWSLGILTFEMFTGVPPFHDETQKKIFKNVLSGKFEFPKDINISYEAIDFIKKLLVLEPEKRLGNVEDDVINHPFLFGIKKNNLIPPFIPELKSIEDTCYFIDRNQYNIDKSEDILSDIYDDNPCRMQNQSRGRSLTTSILSHKFLPNSFREIRNQNNELDDMNSMSIPMLQKANNQVLKELRKSTTNFSPKSFEDNHKTFETRKRRSTLLVRSRDDSFLKDFNINNFN